MKLVYLVYCNSSSVAQHALVGHLKGKATNQGGPCNGQVYYGDPTGCAAEWRGSLPREGQPSG